MDYKAIKPIKQCLKSIMGYVDTDKNPMAKEIIKIILENLYIIAEINYCSSMLENKENKNV